MIRAVSFEGTTFAPIPSKFEAGTPNVAGAVGLGATIDYLASLDWDALTTYEDDVLRYAIESIGSVPGVRLFGTAKSRGRGD